MPTRAETDELGDALTVDDLIEDAGAVEVSKLKKQHDADQRTIKRLRRTIERAQTIEPTKAPKVRPPKPKATKHITRVIIPDSHGEHIDLAARDAFLNDLPMLDPQQIVFLGDHLDCGGTLSGHQKSFTHELTESYSADVAACNHFLDEIDKRCPDAEKDYIFGNHEHRIERWAARNFDNAADARLAAELLGPAAVLNLKGRGYKWYTPGEMYHGLSVPGTIKKGKCHFTHGMSAAKHAASVHLNRVGANVVFGHVHRVQHVGENTVNSGGIGAWTPGTLAKLQPLYMHTRPTDWQHGYGVQFVSMASGRFVHINVPIVGGESLLVTAVDALRVVGK